MWYGVSIGFTCVSICTRNVSWNSHFGHNRDILSIAIGRCKCVKLIGREGEGESGKENAWTIHCPRRKQYLNNSGAKMSSVFACYCVYSRCETQALVDTSQMLSGTKKPMQNSYSMCFTASTCDIGYGWLTNKPALFHVLFSILLHIYCLPWIESVVVEETMMHLLSERSNCLRMDNIVVNYSTSSY